MNLRALEVFVGVIEAGTLTDAARGLHLSQSAASRLLSLLEADLGAALFRREKRQLVPTSAAEALYPEARRILAQVSALPEVASGTKAGAALRVICHARLAGGLVVPAIETLARHLPGRVVRLETAPRRELARRVIAGRYDIAVAVLPLSLGACEARPLARLRLGVVLPRDHPLAAAPSIDLSDLDGTPYIALDETTAVRRTLDAAFEADGRRLVPSHEVSTGTNAYRLVAAGLGFTFADPIALDPELREALVLVPWRREVTMEIGCFSLADSMSDAGTFMLEALQDITRSAEVRHARPQ